MAVCGQRDPLGPAPSDLQQYDVLGRVTLASIFSGFLHLLYTDYSSVRLGYHCVCLCVFSTLFILSYCVLVLTVLTLHLCTHMCVICIFVFIFLCLHTVHIVARVPCGSAVAKRSV